VLLMGRPDRAPPDAARTEAAWGTFADGLRRWLRARTRDDALADDLLQITFLRVHERLPDLGDETRIAGWIWQIARNALADHYRARSVPVEPPDPDDAPDDALTGLAGWLAGEVAALPPQYRDAVRLTEIDGLTMRAAADALGLSVSGAKSRVQRGRALLRARLLRCCAVEVDARGRPFGFEGRSHRCGCA
jgi:RNA polymerase sigma-70 factor (ECF subfamily)